MNPATQHVDISGRLQGQLLDRRTRLQRSIGALGHPEDLIRLLGQVDAALDRMQAGRFGECSICHEALGEEELLATPLAEYCLCHLTPEKQIALQDDLDLAWRVQAALLPAPDLAAAGWQTHYRYLPHGPVSGDYCDLIAEDSGQGLYFALGDVSGKGVAASLLMSHLNASFRAFVQSGLAPQQLVDKADQLLSHSSLATHYATLVCGRAASSGDVELVNAGHGWPMIVRAYGEVEVLKASGLPVGLGVSGANPAGYMPQRVHLNPGDSLVLYTDGLTEAINTRDEEFGAARLAEVLAVARNDSPRGMARKSLDSVSSFLQDQQLRDDLTLLVLRKD